MDVSEARRLKALENENTKLKKLLADAMLDNVALKDLVAREVAVITTLRWSGSSGSALRGRPGRCAARERAT